MSLTFSDICNDIKTFLESICRTCSRIENGEEDLQLKRIFAISESQSALNNEEPINYSASDELKDVFDEILLWKLNIKPDDGLPQQICRECLERFNGVKNFRSICIETQTLLKSYVNHVDTLLESGSLGRLSPKSGSLKSEVCNSPAPLLNADDLVEESPETPERQMSQHSSPQLSPKYEPTQMTPRHNAEAVYAESSMGTPPPLFDEMRTEPIDMVTMEYLKAESDIETQNANISTIEGEASDILHPLNFVSSSSSGSEGEGSDDEPFTDSEMNTMPYNMNLLRRKTQEKEFICKLCSKCFKTKYQLSQHKYKHNRLDTLKCMVCGKHFRSQLHLQRHHKNFHLTSTYTCHICTEKFENYTQMRFQYHVRQHGEKRFQCQYCEKSFHQKIHLTNHERTHTKEQPFRCDICGKSYRQQTACREHMLTHQDPTPFKCTICSKGFTQRSTLRTHLRRHSKHNNNNNQQIFNSESSAQHFSKESPFGRYQLHHKSYKFELNSQLLNINAQGFAHKVLNCKFCDKSFQKQQLLLLHIQQSHDVSIENEGDLRNWLPFHTQINNHLSPSRKDTGTDKRDLTSLFNI